MRKVLITGGAGFIGSHLTHQLSKNFNVFVLDNLTTGKRSYIPKGTKLFVEDIRKKQAVFSIFKKINPDIVFHVAGQSSIHWSFVKPLIDFDINLNGTANIVFACLKGNATRLIYASSMTVYGHAQKIPVSENSLAQPISYYGISKYAAERFIHVSAARSDLKHPFYVTSFRMFNVYGPKQSTSNPYQGALAFFLGNVLRNEPITIYGDGAQTRDFIYIDDVTTAWIKAIDAKQTYQKIYNLGSGKQISILDVARQTILSGGYSDKSYPIIYKSARYGEQRFIKANIQKIAFDLNFRPKISFKIGLAQTFQWAKQNRF